MCGEKEGNNMINNKNFNEGCLCIAKTTLLPYRKHLNVLDVDFGDGISTRVIVPDGLPMVCIDDFLELNGLGKGKNHELMATNYRIIGRGFYFD